MYQGTKQLQIGNGSGLFIQSTGSSSIYSRSIPLKLQNILHVPAIKNNLLSIYQLTNDNYVYVEFHVDHCIIKEEGTGRPLLKGTVRDGLYLLNQDNNHQPLMLQKRWQWSYGINDSDTLTLKFFIPSLQPIVFLLLLTIKAHLVMRVCLPNHTNYPMQFHNILRADLLN